MRGADGEKTPTELYSDSFFYKYAGGLSREYVLRIPSVS